MKRTLWTLVAVLMFVLGGSVSAQQVTTRRPTQKSVGDVPVPAGPYRWQHYNVDPCVPERMLPTDQFPSDNDGDKSKIIKIVDGSDPRYTQANNKQRACIGAKLYGNGHDVPDSVWADIRQQFVEGQIHEVCFNPGDRVGDYGSVWGSTVTNGIVNLHNEPDVINDTGVRVCAWETNRQVQILPGEWRYPFVIRQCRNVGAHKASAPPPPPAPVTTVRSEPPQSAPTPAPAPAAPAAPAAPLPVYTPPASETHTARAAVTLGAGWIYGKVGSSYSGAVQPGTGDATQNNNYSSFVPTVRFETTGNGPFAAANGTIGGSTGNKTFDGGITKIRNSDETVDKRVEFLGGWKFGVGSATVAPFIGYQKTCLCEQYSAQGAQTTTERSYKGPMVGGDLAFAGEGMNPAYIVHVRATYGFAMTRSQWTQQTYPGVDFPRVTNPDASASSVGFRPQADLRIFKGFYGSVAYDFLHISSQRTNTFEADEGVNLHTVVLGVSYRLKF